MIHIFLPQRIKRNIRNKALLGVISAIATIIMVFILFAVGLRFTENITWEESFWQSWQTITTVGYGNAPAETLSGRIVTIVLGTLGLVFLGEVIAKISDYVYDNRRRLSMGLKDNKYENGYVIFNYPGDHTIKKIIKQWRSVEKDVPVCLVDEKLEEKPKVLDMFENTHFISGTLLDRDTLNRSNIKNNKVAIIYPQNDTPSSDATTSKLADIMIQESEARVICVVNDIANNRWLFNKNEITLIDEDLETTLIVQECQDPYTAPCIEKLLSNIYGANPETVELVHSVGYSWCSLQQRLLDYSIRTGINVNLFALISHGETFTCPDMNTRIFEGDMASIIMYPQDKINWKKLEKELFND